MTVTALTSRNTYTGTGSSVPYPYTFRIFAATDLSVIKRTTATGLETTLAYPGDFSVTGVGNANGGTVTLTVALAVGETVAIRRVRPVKQQTALRNQGTYFPAEVENAIDSGIMIAQQHEDALGRALKLPLSIDPADFDMIIPATLTPGMALVVNGAGTGFSQASLSAAQLADWNAAQNMREDVFLSTVDFTAGSTTELTLSDAPGDAANISIIRTTSGTPVVYTSDQYSVVGTTLTFGSALPANTSRVEVRYLLTYQVNTVDSANATYNADGAGAIVRSVRDVLRDQVLITDYGADPFGSAADNVLAIQRAIDAGAATGRRVRMVAGAVPYLITPDTAVTDETGAAFACFLMRSGMHLDFDPGCTLMIENGVSTAAATVQMRMFFTNEVLADVSFTGGTLDMNGANNRISPNGGPYTRLNQAHIWVSGTNGGGANAARIDGVLIEDVDFINGPGTTCICMAQSNTAGITLGSGWTVKKCGFYNNGFDTDDHSTIFGWADDVTIDDNDAIGVADVFDVGVFHEIHGARQKLTNNRVQRYMQLAWAGSNYTSDVTDSLIANNTATDLTLVGVDFFRQTAAEFAVARTVIDTNTFAFTDAVFLNTGVVKVAVQINTNYAVDGVTVSNNTVKKPGATTALATGWVVASAVAAQVHGKIVYSGNKQYGGTFGVALFPSATNNLDTIEVCDHKGFDLTPTTVFTTAMGVGYFNGLGAVNVLTVKGNTFSDTRGSPLWQHGTYLSGGAIGQLNYRGNDHSGMTVSDYHESSVTVTTRMGDHDGLPFTTVWSAGTPITVGNGSVVTSYDVHDKRITFRSTLTIGSTTVIPAGVLSATLPYPSTVSGQTYMGAGRILDQSAMTFYAGVADIDGTASICTLQFGAGGNATDQVPVILAVDDKVSVDVTYLS